MSDSLKATCRKIATSILMSTGILAVANIHTAWDEKMEPLTPSGFMQPTNRRLAATEAVDVPQLDPKSQLLRESLLQDELLEGNPFASLSSSEPFNEIYKKGVVSFDRQTYRSAYYVDEFGYDLIRYEVIHPDQSRSQILAYVEVERVFAEDGESVSTGGKSPAVWVVTPGEQASHLYSYKDGLLREHKEIPASEADELVGQRLTSSVPYFSVSR